jgi:hypothetical protein
MLSGKVYKITCNVDDRIYIGSTTQELSQRMSCHRSAYKKQKQNENITFPIYQAFDEIGIEFFQIELIENVKCETKDELFAKEAHYQRELNTKDPEKGFNCVYAHLSDEQRKKYNCEKSKKWAEKNPEKIQKMSKNYYDNNSVKIIEKSKIYRKENPEKVAQSHKNWADKNKEHRQDYMKGYNIKYREENREELNEKARKFHEEHKEERNKKRNERYHANREENLQKNKIPWHCDSCNQTMPTSSRSRHLKSAKHLKAIQQPEAEQ